MALQEYIHRISKRNNSLDITSFDSPNNALLSEWPRITQGISRLTSISALQQKRSQFINSHILKLNYKHNSFTKKCNNMLESLEDISMRVNKLILIKTGSIRKRMTFSVLLTITRSSIFNRGNLLGPKHYELELPHKCNNRMCEMAYLTSPV